jgi:hypothetical protein
LESSRTVIVVTALLKEDERGGQSHISASLSHQSATLTPFCEKAFLYTSAFSTLCFVLSVTDGKIEQHVRINLYMKIGKSITKPLEMLHEAFGEHSSSSVFNGIHVSRSVECQLNMTNVHGEQVPSIKRADITELYIC